MQTQARRGFGDWLRLRYTTMMAKWCWRYRMEPDASWVKVVKSMYCQQKAALQKKWIVPQWAALEGYITAVPTIEVFKDETGDGSRTSFGMTKWTKDLILKDGFSSCYALFQDGPVAVFSHQSASSQALNLHLRREVRQRNRGDQLIALAACIGEFASKWQDRGI